MQGCAHPLPRSEREREKEREREREKEGERKSEKEKDIVFIFKGITGAFTPFSYLVQKYTLKFSVTIVLKLKIVIKRFKIRE